ncbi:RING-H2 finger protein ATL39-like [Ipomoea triloba]|uniref:RING-H2 finger protein ATL39-like n=1 Tax=Ipomoea triloba TaxID=35885 RepID=UPI00125D928C|nr:RING-H2 finger protein ATL39-like [Ipomoea triloba]
MRMSSEELETTNSWHSTDLNAFTSHYFRHHGLLLFTLLLCFLIFLLAFFFFYFINKFTGGANFPAPRPAEAPPPTKGLDAESIQTLPAVAYVSLGVKDMSECSICLGLFEEVEIVKVMPECCHVFHGACVDTWLSTRPSCPLCRASLDSVSA